MQRASISVNQFNKGLLRSDLNRQVLSVGPHRQTIPYFPAVSHAAEVIKCAFSVIVDGKHSQGMVANFSADESVKKRNIILV
jgi:hypothetical protein